MAFKAKKLNIDLELDLTEYIQGDEGILKTDKTEPELIKEWFEFALDEGEKIQKLRNEVFETKIIKTKDGEEIINELRENSDYSMKDITNEANKSTIKQIDFFYNKGEKFYKKIPSSILNEILAYINGQLSPAKKKSMN